MTAPADLDAIDRGQLLAWGTGVRAPCPQSGSVMPSIEQHIVASPDAPAIVAGGRTTSRAELDRRTRHLEGRLVACDLEPRSPVAVCLPRGADQIAAVLATLRRGCTFVPLDPAQPPDRLAWMMADARAAAVLTTRAFEARLGSAAVRVVCVDEIAGDAAPLALSRAATDPAQPAYIVYTSGSTGKPKGVVVSHRALLHSTDARRTYYRRPVERYLLVSTLAFDSALAGLFWTLYDGGTLVLPSDEAHADPLALRHLISAHRVTHLLCLPSLYAWVLEPDAEGLQSLAVAIVAGEACSRQIAARHHAVLPAAELHNEYGPTECSVWSTVHASRPDETGDSVPIGKPIPRATAYVAGSPATLVPAGVAGELLVGGAGLADGYRGRPDLTAERFVPDQWSATPGARAYRTGDKVRWLADGSLEFLGRLDRQIKLRGYRIELEEIELALAAHDAVQECAVAVSADGGRVDAFVVLRQAVPDAPAALREHARSRLPEYMVPAGIIEVPGLPRTPNGKIDREALASMSTGAPRSVGAAARSPSETIVAGLWQELLGRPQIGLDENFFDIGGHSLLAIEVFTRLRQTVAPQLTLVDLFQYPTVRTLAVWIDRQATPEPAVAEAAAAMSDARGRRQALGARGRAARAS